VRFIAAGDPAAHQYALAASSDSINVCYSVRLRYSSKMRRERKQDSDRSHPTSGYDVAQTIASGTSLDRPIFGQQRSRVGGWPIAATVAVLAVILYAVRYALHGLAGWSPGNAAVHPTPDIVRHRRLSADPQHKCVRRPLVTILPISCVLMSVNRTSTDNTAQTGVNAAEGIFLSMKWLFRRQLESDFGIDAHAEVVDNEGNPTGQLIGIQIKSGSSFFRLRDQNYVFRGEQRHLDYWERHCLPIILVLHNPVDGMTLWQRIERHFVTEGAHGTWSIDIPKWQKLDATSADPILRSVPRSDPESDRRNRMVLDAVLIRRVSEEGQAYVSIHEWINKSLNFRSASISFDEYDAAPADAVEFYMRAPNVSRVFDWIYPWLQFEYLDMPKDDNGEVMEHCVRSEAKRSRQSVSYA
jgi:hypothetical protein